MSSICFVASDTYAAALTAAIILQAISRRGPDACMGTPNTSAPIAVAGLLSLCDAALLLRKRSRSACWVRQAGEVQLGPAGKGQQLASPMQQRTKAQLQVRRSGLHQMTPGSGASSSYLRERPIPRTGRVPAGHRSSSSGGNLGTMYARHRLKAAAAAAAAPGGQPVVQRTRRSACAEYA